MRKGQRLVVIGDNLVWVPERANGDIQPELHYDFAAALAGHVNMNKLF